jgi:hypothetical protein
MKRTLVAALLVAGAWLACLSTGSTQTAAAAQLRAKYLPVLSQAIGGRKGATFAQLDRRVSLMIELQLASQVPLVQSQ